jgi:hypothetical protein
VHGLDMTLADNSPTRRDWADQIPENDPYD